MSGLIYNLHNHTPFSDGAYSIDELCDLHLSRKDIKVDGIGISDHLFRTPTSRVPADDREFDRIFAPETARYVAEVRAARQRWAGKLQIFCGAEIHWPMNKGHLNIIRNLLSGLDYVLIELIDWAGLTALANQARRWPCHVGLAHADVGERFPNTSQDQVVRTMANARIFYELNAVMMPLRDSDPWLSLLPKHRVFVTIGTDTHDDLSCLRMLKPMYDLLVKTGLEQRMLRFAPASAPPQPQAATA